jgi:hypothetical protein
MGHYAIKRRIQSTSVATNFITQPNVWTRQTGRVLCFKMVGIQSSNQKIAGYMPTYLWGYANHLLCYFSSHY